MYTVTVTDEMVVDVLIAASGGEPPPYIFDSRSISDVRQALEKIVSAISPAPVTQCCMCGKTGLSTVEGDGGSECQLSDGRWTCSFECWERATERDVPPAPMTDSDVREEAAELVKELHYWADDADLPACERALRNAARFIEGVTLAPAAEPVGTVVKMPGSTGFTMAVFGAEQVPAGTSLYTAPPAPVADGWRPDAEKMREDCARWCEMNGFSEAAPMLRKLPISRFRAASTEAGR